MLVIGHMANNTYYFSKTKYQFMLGFFALRSDQIGQEEKQMNSCILIKEIN